MPIFVQQVICVVFVFRKKQIFTTTSFPSPPMAICPWTKSPCQRARSGRSRAPYTTFTSREIWEKPFARRPMIATTIIGAWPPLLTMFHNMPPSNFQLTYHASVCCAVKAFHPAFHYSVFHPTTGINMEISTTQPGVLMYTGNYLNDSVIGKYGEVLGRHAAVCFETQGYPNAINVVRDHRKLTLARGWGVGGGG